MKSNSEMIIRRVAIIGAGVSGLACAAELQDYGLAVTLFEKSGDIGGRLAARRRGGGVWSHGAPAVAAREAAFREFLTEQVAVGRALLLDGPDPLSVAGLPDMRELTRGLAAGLDIRFGTEVAAIARDGACWTLTHETSSAGPFDVLLTAIPAPQVLALLARSGLMVPAGLTDVVMAPRWSLLVGFSSPPPPWTADQEPVESLVTMPACTGTELPHCFVLHATEAWSRQHLELDRPEAAARLSQALQAVPAADDWLAAADVIKAHRWRYALTDQPLGRPCVYEADRGLGHCGDWCTGATAEAAFASGQALARAAMATSCAGSG